MRKTNHYGLTLYDKNDKMLITPEENSLNANMSIIDSALKEKASIGDMTAYIEEHKDELRGEQGPQGIQGIQGEKGADGAPGKDGVDGKDGAQGPKGDKGDTGAQGEQGIQGPKGDKGDTGATGPAGADGKTPVKGTDYFTDADKQEIAQAASVLVNVPENVSAFTNDAEYISNKPGLVNERLDSNLYGWIEGKYCNKDNGNIYEVSHCAVSDCLAIDTEWQKIKTYVQASGDSAGICFYDSTKKFISGVGHGNTNGVLAMFEYDIPGNAAYFRVSTRTAAVSSSYIEIVKYEDGVLTRISALEASSGKASAITYGYAMSNVLCIGDSLTAGAYYAGEENNLDISEGASIAQNYPYYLGRMLHCRTTNAGTSGYSASDWYNKYINKYTYADYDTFIIWLGTNYGCNAMPTDAEISAFVPSSSDTAATANQALYLIKIIQTIQAANASCHIALGSVFGSKSNKTTNNEVVAQIAEKYGCQLVDMSDLSYSNHPELHAGINNPHFGKAGNIFIANRFALAINDYLASNPRTSDFGTTVNPMPTLTASEQTEIINAVIAALPVYSGEVI